MLEKMIHPERGEIMKEAEIKPYTAPHFLEKENLLKLGVRMARGGMACAVPEVKGTSPLFTVVKKAELNKGRASVSLKLIFDLRLENLGWQDAPWCGLGGVSSMSFLDVSEEAKNRTASPCSTRSATSRTTSASSRSRSRCPSTSSSRGCRRPSSARHWGPRATCSQASETTSGSACCPCKRAVYLAQTCLEDTFEGGSSDHPELGPERRVMEGAPLPPLKFQYSFK